MSEPWAVPRIVTSVAASAGLSPLRAGLGCGATVGQAGWVCVSTAALQEEGKEGWLIALMVY